MEMKITIDKFYGVKTVEPEVIAKLKVDADNLMHADMYEALAKGTEVHYANVSEGPLIICDQQLGCKVCKMAHPHYPRVFEQEYGCINYKPRVIEVYDEEEEWT
jgi:hypothetical protein